MKLALNDTSIYNYFGYHFSWIWYTKDCCQACNSLVMRVSLKACIAKQTTCMHMYIRNCLFSYFLQHFFFLLMYIHMYVCIWYLLQNSAATQLSFQFDYWLLWPWPLDHSWRSMWHSEWRILNWNWICGSQSELASIVQGNWKIEYLLKAASNLWSNVAAVFSHFNNVKLHRW